MDDKIVSVNLANWDVGYSINFSEINKAITEIDKTPKEFNYTKTFLDEDDEDCFVNIQVTGKYASWETVGSATGLSLGVLCKMSSLKAKKTKYRKTDSESYEIQYNNENYNSLPKSIEEKKYNNLVGVVPEIQLEWKEQIDNKFHLVTTSNTDNISIDSSKYIIYSKDEDLPDSATNVDDFDFTSKTKQTLFGIYLASTLSESITNDIGREFNHIFAELDYTNEAEKVVNWLKLTSHGYTISSSTNINQVDISTIKKKSDKYHTKMDINKGYKYGNLTICGMTDNKEIPIGGCPNLYDIIPENCNAAYTYNDNLIIPHLIKGHLSEIFDCDVLKDFEFTGYDKKTLTNINKISLKNDVILDFSSLASAPKVKGIIDREGLEIKIDGNKIKYYIKIVYSVEKGVLGFGLPYDVDILQSYELDFGYKIEDGFANMALLKEPKIDANLSPKIEDPASLSGFDILKDFGKAVVENLVMTVLTLGLMKAGSAVFNAAKMSYKSIKVKVFDKAGKKVNLNEVGEIKASESVTESFLKNNENELKKISESKSLISRESEEAIKNDAAKKQSKFSDTGKNVVYELIAFSVAQVMVSKLKENYQKILLHDLTHTALSKEFSKFIDSGVCKIKWNNQNKETNFKIIDGNGLSNGGFIVGINLDFNHNK